ncbi:MAG TPA: hypothetical protein VIW69_02245 [Candidatus Elarobacter sp.]
MSPHSIIRTLAAAALIALPSIAMAAPDQNTNNNGCPNGQWRNGNGQCVTNGNGQYNNNGNGQWNNGRHRDRDDRNRRDNDDRNNRNNNGQYNNGQYNNGQYNNGGYNNGGYNNGNYGNRSGQLSGQVSSFSPYNLYLSNGTHVVLHNGTVINPTGTNLTSGERVRVIGNWNQDGTFNANEVDVTNNGNYRR